MPFNEGTYSALITKSVSRKQVNKAISRAERKLDNGKKYQSEIAMWREVNKVYTSEFAKIGVKISYKEQIKKSRKLITQNIGTF